MTQTAVPPGELKRGSCWGADGVYYPAEYPETMPFTDFAVRLLLYFFMALNHVFEKDPEVYVGADQFVYWDPVNSRKRVAPDGYVLFGVPKRPLHSVIRTWELAVPRFVVEVSSQKSRREDRGRKFRIYRDELRVPEYLIYDEPRSELLLYRLGAEEYHLQQPDGRGWLYSQELNVSFAPDEELGVRIYGPSGRREPGLIELFLERDELREHAQAATHVARMLLGEALRERDRAAAEERKLAAERRRAGELEGEIAEARRLAESERQRADALTAELERLRRERDGQ